MSDQPKVCIVRSWHGWPQEPPMARMAREPHRAQIGAVGVLLAGVGLVLAFAWATAMVVAR